MSEVTAQMIERGRKGDPAEASRRRKMNIKLKHARQTLTSSPGDDAGPYDSLVRLFAQSAKSATPAIAVLTVAVGAAAQLWAPAGATSSPGTRSRSWRVALRYALGSIYLKLPDPEKVAGRWRVYFALAEACRRRRPGRRSCVLLLQFARSQRARLPARRADAGGRHDRDGRLGDSGAPSAPGCCR